MNSTSEKYKQNVKNLSSCTQSSFFFLFSENVAPTGNCARKFSFHFSLSSAAAVVAACGRKKRSILTDPLSEDRGEIIPSSQFKSPLRYDH